MSSLDAIRSERISKLNKLREFGIDPYPIKTSRIIPLVEVERAFSKLSRAKKSIYLAGRVLGIREHGGAQFIDFSDGTISGHFQALLKKDELKKNSFELFRDTVDMGDFIELYGVLFITKRGEKTIDARAWKMLAKGIRPLPDKWHGLTDVEERFRKRYLDLLMSRDVKSRFVIRARVISALRNFLESNGFLEVETPILQALAGGATAEPFRTHHRMLDMDLYLRIAPELYHKKLLIGNIPKVYEIGKSFRNEGIDATHNPEFTEVEWYEAYSDATKQRAFVEKLMRHVAKKTLGSLNLTYGGHAIDLKKSFLVVSYEEVLRRYALLPSLRTLSREEADKKAIQLNISIDDSWTTEKIVDHVYKKVCRPKLIDPTFIVDYPVDYLPLAKRLPADPSRVDAFQLVIAGIEFVKAFSELNDPLDQDERFKKELLSAEKGDIEAHPMDNEFVEAMEYGMPPAGGVGIGIDRLVMLLTDSKNIKEVILFPTMKTEPKS